MQEIRCTKCGKILCKVTMQSESAASFDRETTVNKVSALTDGVSRVIIKSLQIKCPHNYRDGNGKNVQCKTLNEVVV